MSLGVSLGVPFKHGFGGGLPSSAFLLQKLVGTTDGQMADDSLSIVTPEPNYTQVPIITFKNGTSYATLPYPSVSVTSIEYIVNFRTDGLIFTGEECLGSLFDSALPQNSQFDLEFSDNITPDRLQVSWSSIIIGFYEATNLRDDAWHMLKVQVTSTTCKVWLDGGTTPIIDETGAYPTLANCNLFSLRGNSSFQYWYPDGDMSYIKCTLNYAETADCIFESYLDEGRGAYCYSRNADSLDNRLVIEPGIVSLDAIRTTTDEQPSASIREGFVQGINLNGVDQAIHKLDDAYTSNAILKMECKLWVTGELDQTFSNQNAYTQGFLSMLVNSTGHAVHLSFYTGGSQFTSVATSLDAGWHTIRIESPDSATRYSIYIDDQLQTVGFSGGALTYAISNHSLGVERLDTTPVYYPNLIRDYYLEVDSVASGYVIKDGVFYPNALAPMVFVSRSGADVPIVLPQEGVPLNQTYWGGYVHNQAPVSMIQDSVDIVDAVLVTNPITYPGESALALRVSDQPSATQFSGGLLGGQLVSLKKLGLGGGWTVHLDGINIAESGSQAPFPPTSDVYANDYIVQHGYEGSFWADEDGEYIEHDWDSLFAHVTMEEMLCAKYIKNTVGNCHLKELAQYSLGYQFTIKDKFAIASWQGTSGCEIPQFPGFKDDAFSSGFGIGV